MANKNYVFSINCLLNIWNEFQLIHIPPSMDSGGEITSK